MQTLAQGSQESYPDCNFSKILQEKFMLLMRATPNILLEKNMPILVEKLIQGYGYGKLVQYSHNNGPGRQRHTISYRYYTSYWG